MRIERRRIFLMATVLLVLIDSNSAGQTSSTAKEVWPAVHATFELQPKTRLLVFVEKHNGEDFSLAQWKVGAIVSYRMKRILEAHRSDIDEENEYNLVVGGGYEYVQTNQNDETKREHRIILQSTPKYIPGAGVLMQDRNRVEFRWTDGAYNFRYRNKLTIDRPFKEGVFRFTPYAAGELFWDRNHHAWNQNQYAFGVQLPYKRRLMLDTYYLRQNCTTCSQDPVNVFGVTLNVYFRRKK
jgi:uncharacterized protein DUF2490